MPNTMSKMIPDDTDINDDVIQNEEVVNIELTTDNNENNENNLNNENKDSMFKNMFFSYEQLLKYIKEKQNDQDFMQRVNVASTLLFEIYRVLMGALLMVFVPQKCDDHVCSMNENINRDEILSKAAFGINIITLFSFLSMYFIETKRENKLINYLDVNRFTPVDNESVGNALTKLSDDKKNKIWNYDYYYQKSGLISTSIFGVNAVVSSIVIYNHYLDSKTITVYLTNLLFMGLKVMDVFDTVNTKKNVFYSAYLKNKVQFNDVDPDKIIKNEKNNDEEKNHEEKNDEEKNHENNVNETHQENKI